MEGNVMKRFVPVLLVFLMVIPSCRRQESTSPAQQTSSTGDVGWPGYNNHPDGQRFAALDQINTTNVAKLRQVCELRLGEEGAFQTGPVVVGGVMYLTTAHTTVAMNAATCGVLWRHIDAGSGNDPIPVNRGVAYLDGRLFRGMSGTRLASLDAKTGKVLWDVKAGNVQVGEFISSAPIAWRNMVFVGLAGGDWGIRGRVMGFDAATGKEKWRFYTIPMGSERGAETWHIPASAERGGGAQWTSYSLDTESGELFVPVGNPAPDFAPDARPGDNLFTNGIVVLDAASGRLNWWFQATPRDGFDYDVGAAPMIYTTKGGEGMVAVGSKDGHVYGVNRTTHAALFKTPVTTILNADKKPTLEGLRACPGPLGGVEWNGPAFDPGTRAIYVGAVDWCATFKLGAEIVYKPGDLYMGTAHVGDPNEMAKGWVTALDGATGRVLWRVNTPQPVVAGVTPTAGGLLFTGDMAGTFYALDKATGKILFTAATGGPIAGGVVTYMVGKTQYVATTSGNISRTGWATPPGTPRLIVMALDSPENSPRMMVALPEFQPGGGAATGVQAGQQQYEQFCAGCHGTHAEGGAGGPTLLGPTSRKTAEAIAAFIRNPKPPMPKLHPAPLDDAEVNQVAQYVRTLQGAAPATAAQKGAQQH
jgi:alcohol dehydrogenase (cytochrome c)